MKNLSNRNMCNINRNFQDQTLAVVVVATVCLVQQAAAGPQVTDVRIGVYPGKTRVSLDVSATVDFRTFTLPKPYRGYRYVGSDMVAENGESATGAGFGSTGMRFGLFKPGSSRVVLDSAGPVKITKAFMVPPSAPW